MSWRHHPAVRTKGQLTRGERAADFMRNVMGSWGFIFGSLAFLAAWITLALHGVPIDNGQLTILNLALSCFAALQGAILLIAAKRADQKASEVAVSDYRTDQSTLDEVRALRSEFAELRDASRQLLAAQVALKDARQAAADDLPALRAKLNPPL